MSGFNISSVRGCLRLKNVKWSLIVLRAPVERIVGGGEDVPLNVLSVTAVAAGQDHRVLHQFSHDSALKLARYIVPFNLRVEEP